MSAPESEEQEYDEEQRRLPATASKIDRYLFFFHLVRSLLTLSYYMERSDQCPHFNELDANFIVVRD